MLQWTRADWLRRVLSCFVLLSDKAGFLLSADTGLRHRHVILVSYTYLWYMYMTLQRLFDSKKENNHLALFELFLV